MAIPDGKMNNYVPNLIAESAGVSRVQQVFQSFMIAFKEQRIRPGDKLPSVRVCAHTFKISPSTIVAAFDWLKEEGIIESQRGSGFYLAENFLEEQNQNLSKEHIRNRKKNIELPIDDSWLLANVYRADNTDYHSVGCGWLPSDWYAQQEIAKALRDISRNEGFIDYGYGNPYGNSELRIHLAHMLAERSMHVQCDNILLTSGASRALDLIASAFLNTNDTVLVDEPGYCNFLSSMLGKRIKLIGVKWTSEGPDIRQMERILEKENVSFYFTNPWLHNPTGANISLKVAHRLLTLAERYQLTVVEDNVSGDLVNPGAVTLAALAGLERVIHIGSFSKSMSPNLRVGYIVSAPDTINTLMRYKMMSGLTSSSLTEKIVLNVLQQVSYKKHLKLIRGRLSNAQREVCHLLKEINWEVFCEPNGGFYVYSRPRGVSADSRLIAEEAKKAGLLFAPGYLFHPEHNSSSWIRFNAAFFLEKFEYLYPFLRGISASNYHIGN